MTDAQYQQYQQPRQSLRLSIAQRGLPASPVITSGESSSGVTRLSRYGSISTLATSNAMESSEWYEDDKMQNTGAEESADYDVEVRLPASQRPKGCYSLNSFTMMRDRHHIRPRIPPSPHRHHRTSTIDSFFSHWQ